MSKVTIEKHESRLRLRWQHLEKRFTLAVGMPDSVVGRSKAQQVSGRTLQDIATGHFDQTLLAYKPLKLGKTRTELTCPELFAAHTQAMSKDKGDYPPVHCIAITDVLAHLRQSLDTDANLVNRPPA